MRALVIGALTSRGLLQAIQSSLHVVMGRITQDWRDRVELIQWSSEAATADHGRHGACFRCAQYEVNRARQYIWWTSHQKSLPVLSIAIFILDQLIVMGGQCQTAAITKSSFYMATLCPYSH